ncbi:hypothetical protein FGO68_gene734 [Halteria grandinella]|uniref:Uncharacterized protein n=1 Tax=Halteria grandinella TaxID=5974 RepID=A0A8J8NTV3_HALGN|nr:hypothetical protein FGO68_gene734 [Halteria grandinella]
MEKEADTEGSTMKLHMNAQRQKQESIAQGVSAALSLRECDTETSYLRQSLSIGERASQHLLKEWDHACLSTSHQRRCLGVHTKQLRISWEQRA